MKIIVNFAKAFYQCYMNAERPVRAVMHVGMTGSVLACAAAIAALAAGRSGFDAATAEYWAQQFFLLSVQLLGATQIPALLCETLLYASGAKSGSRENGGR